MVDVGTRPRDGRGSTPEQQDWPAQAADTIERVVRSVRDRTTGPALTVSRGVVYGTFAAIVGVAALVLAIAGMIRLVDVYLPDSVFGEDHTWVVHGLFGIVFSLAGIVLWSRRQPGAEETTAD